MTALQLSTPNDVLGRVFGAFNTLILLALLVGSAVVPIVIDVVGLGAMVWVAGLGIPLACLAGWPSLHAMDVTAAARREQLASRVSLLSACDLFASVSDGAVTQLADAAELIDVKAGVVVINQDATPDAFYIIESGTFTPAAVNPLGQAVVLPDMHAGDYFGEIGLSEAVPRTATVKAGASGRLLRVDGAAFITALTQQAPAPAFLDGASSRLSRTNPNARLAQAGLGESSTG